MVPKAWSHSSLSDFESCPRAYYEKRIVKSVKDTQGVAAAWGEQVHTYFEYDVKRRNGTPITAEEEKCIATNAPNSAYAAPLLDTLFEMQADAVHPELELAIDKAFKPCAWDAPEVWCRGIIDVLLIKGTRARALDWKTGKRKLDSRQLKLFALLIFAHFPEIAQCKTDFVWLKTSEIDSAVYTRAQEGELWQEFLPLLTQYKVAFKTEIFPPKRSGLCNGWCPVTSCENWRPKRG